MSATNITVAIDARAAIELLAATRGVMQARREVHDAAANAVALQVRSWFIARNAAKSKHTSSQYWAQVAESIAAEADADSGRVVVRHPGTAWHRYGGTISAKPGKALAIPLRDEVYGQNPSEFFKSRKDAFVWRSPKGQAFLVAAQGKGAKRGDRTLRILYLLLKSVSKGEDTTVLPSAAEQTEAASAGVRRIVRLTLARRIARTGAA